MVGLYYFPEAISLERVEVPFPKLVTNLPSVLYYMKNHIGPVVNKILRYRRTDRHPVTFLQGLIVYLDYKISHVSLEVEAYI